MSLTRKEFDQLQQALVSAFPDYTGLTSLVKNSFHKNLATIAGIGKHAGLVARLIRWTEAQGRDREFVTQAYHKKPDDPLLRAFVKGAPHLVAWDTLQQLGMGEEDLFPTGVYEPLNASQKASSAPDTVQPIASHPCLCPPEVPGGAIDAASIGYIKRKTDEMALKEICKQGTTIVIQGPHQVGKSSLLQRIYTAAEQTNKTVAQVDLQIFNRTALQDADAFYRQFCFMVTEATGLEDRTEAYWKLPGVNFKCTQYFEKYILVELEKQKKTVVLALDEAERIQDADFSSDFYGMLRSWHGLRGSKSLWKQLDLVLVTSTKPYHLIDRYTQSPFNVGLVLELEDFDRQQVEDLLERYQAVELKGRIEDFWNLLEGHPYLTQKALFAVLNNDYSVECLFAEAIRDRGPFGDHLEYLLVTLNRQEKLIAGMRQVMEKHECQDRETLSHLWSAGLIRQTNDYKVRPRCRLYENYFRTHLPG